MTCCEMSNLSRSPLGIHVSPVCPLAISPFPHSVHRLPTSLPIIELQ